jgi:hypothetical protein
MVLFATRKKKMIAVSHGKYTTTNGIVIIIFLQGKSKLRCGSNVEEESMTEFSHRPSSIVFLLWRWIV